MNFAPPSFDEPKGHPPPSPEPTTTIPNDATGEDAYTRRLRMSQQQPAPQTDPPPPPNAPLPAPPPPPPAESPPALGTISRAPVRYNLPPAPPELPSSEAELEATIAKAEKEDEASQEDPDDKPRSLRPGQAGFAQRLLSKYGWKKGSGLGATGSGIVNPLRVQVEKQKRKPDSEGGGFATPGGRGKIIGGKKKKGADGGGGDSEGGKFGEMSEVVRLEGMLQGLDVQAELERDEGGLMQEIGEECGEKYGRVERVFIGGGNDDPAVFVKFTSQLSALRVCCSFSSPVHVVSRC
jgi:splicing factor 45